MRSWRLLVPSAALVLSTLVAQAEALDAVGEERKLRAIIVVMDLLSQAEQEQVVPWLLERIWQHPDLHVQEDLIQALERKVPPSVLEPQDEVVQDGVPVPATMPSEAEFLARIDALQLNPQHPEIPLTEAMQIAELIDELEDPGLRLQLQRRLEDRLTALQPGEE